MKRIPDFVKIVLAQAVVGFVFNRGRDTLAAAWKQKVLKLKEDRGDTYIDTVKVSLFNTLKKYVKFKNNKFNLVDIQAAAQLNKLPLPDHKITELFSICSIIETHDATGFGYVMIPAWLVKRIEKMLTYLQALERQSSLSPPDPFAELQPEGA